MLTKTKVIVSSVSLLAAMTVLPNFITQTNQAQAAEQSTQFQVNVKESLAVTITTPTEWDDGNANEFLRNKINVNVETNNADGFTASMTTKTASTNLTHSENKGTISTLSSASSYSNFPVNRWGYSLNDTDAGNTSSTYRALVGAGSTPITIISNSESQTINSRDVWFGAKADMSKATGTYSSTVVISVVTGVIDPNDNPVTPVDPATPSNNNETAEYNSGTGGSASGTTTYTYRRTNSTTGTSSVTTQVSDGDNRDAYIGYSAPQGVVDRKTTTESITEGSSLATGLAVTSAVAAISGTIFFILAKRKKDEDEDEEEEQPNL